MIFFLGKMQPLRICKPFIDYVLILWGSRYRITWLINTLYYSGEFWQNISAEALLSLTIFDFLFLARATDTEEKEFLEEIDLIKSIGFHKNIINMIGASIMVKPIFLVLEYKHYGDLLHYLRKKRADVSFQEILVCY